MPNENGNGRRVGWGEIIYRTVLMAMVIGGGGAGITNAINTAKIETQIVAHLTGHPDVGLTLRMNAMQGDHDDLERRVRVMEIRLGTYDTAE